jgi:ankyrin repeat protein
MKRDNSVAIGLLRKLGLSLVFASATLATLGGVVASPAAAQFQSDGYKFLKAVDEKDGDTVTEMLNEPGTTIVNSRDITSGDTGLHVVLNKPDAQTTTWIKFLLQRGADPNIRNKKGVTPLQLATTLNLVDAVEALIKRGAQVNISDQTGETPLIAAVHQRSIPMIRRLLAQGADPDHNDNSGRSARDYVALMNSNTLILREFEAADEERKKAGTSKQYGPSF